MNNTSPVATATASGGVVGAVVMLVVWGLSLVKVTVPAEVATAMMVILTPILHTLAVKYGFDPAKPGA